MAESVYLKRVKEFVKDMSDKVMADDGRFKYSVLVVHEEGTTYFFRNAFMININTPGQKEGYTDWWVAVITERHGDHVFATDELAIWQMFAQEIENVEQCAIEGIYDE